MIFAFVIGILSITSDIIYWIKWIAAYITIRIFKIQHHRRFDVYDPNAINDPVKLNFLVPQVEIDLESPLPESHLAIAADEVFFYGVNSKSECVVFRIARGCNQEADAWIYLKLENGKKYQLVETSGYQQTYGDKCSTFNCGGLQMHYLSPMRRWRIFYSGMLRETTHMSKSKPSVVFVKFSFLWKASSDVYDLPSDFQPSTTASALANVKWEFPFIPPLAKLTEALDMYCQTGSIAGTVSVEDQPEYEMNLFGEKVRYTGKSSRIAGCKFSQLLGCTPETGLTLHAGKISAPRIFENLSFGFIVPPDGDITPVKDSNVMYKLFSPDKSASTLNADFSAGEKYELIGDIISKPVRFTSKQGWEGYMELCYAEFELKDYKGSGVVIYGEVFKEPSKPLKKQYYKIPEDIPLTVRFTDDISHFPDISGGKGSSLGMLTKLSHQDKTFVVPKGIIVTTSAYDEFLTSEITSEVKNLENIAYGSIKGDVQEACEKLSNIIVKTPLPNKICRDIKNDLNFLYDGKINHHKFAVRSSATGEDTDQMSAAGQMDTFLGVQGLKEILIALKKCWASQFGYIAIEYKRRYGQVLNSPMAVVIQEMVECEVSGVLFTCDPVTNNPSQITITGNYGLGESVVSGSEEPDTIILERKGNQVKLKSRNIGAKQHKIIMQENGGTIIEDVTENERTECCLSLHMAEKLGNLAIKIEKYYKSPRDIEWGVHNDTIYILQSRPVTSGSGETDFEIKHEFDAPLRNEREYFSVCNVGEVLPGATTPLGIDVILKYFSSVMKRKANAKTQSNDFLQNKYFPNGILPFYNHMMLSVVNLIVRMGDLDSVGAQGSMIGIFGRILDDPEIVQLSIERRGKTAPSGGFLDIIIPLFFSGYGLKRLKKEIDNYRFPIVKCKTSKEIFHAIMHSCSSLEEAFQKHMRCSEMSSIWNMFMFSILSKAKGTIDNDVYSDFASFLSSSSNVESADVPSAIQNLAYWISKDMKSEDFKSMSVEEAQNWLLTSQTASRKKFCEFLKRHGHRCLKEFDMRSITWESDPKPLVKLLQNLSGVTENTSEKEDSTEKIFSELKTPLNFKSKLLLKLILPHCRRGVRNREFVKSILIKAVDAWRKAFQHLAKFMVSEGRIPDADLLNFFALEEIEDLLKSRSPKLLARANHRRKIYPLLDKYRFPEILRGIPIPINDEESEEDQTFIADLTMQGIPVSQGVTKGKARVAITLEEAAFLEPGEILITYSTDIGWSPYFPILSGVVTELGGLISHGAVVSREYGLPCVVGLHGVTRKFQTGDYVLLDGSKGILKRLSKPES